MKRDDVVKPPAAGEHGTPRQLPKSSSSSATLSVTEAHPKEEVVTGTVAGCGNCHGEGCHLCSGKTEAAHPKEEQVAARVPCVWREADDLIICKLPGMEEFRISNEGAELLRDQLMVVVPWKKEASSEPVNLPRQNELLPCPFCGSRDAKAINLGQDDPFYAVQCWRGDRVGCGATVGSQHGWDDARSRWNKRAEISVPDSFHWFAKWLHSKADEYRQRTAAIKERGKQDRRGQSDYLEGLWEGQEVGFRNAAREADKRLLSEHAPKSD